MKRVTVVRSLNAGIRDQANTEAKSDSKMKWIDRLQEG